MEANHGIEDFGRPANAFVPTSLNWGVTVWLTTYPDIVGDRATFRRHGVGSSGSACFSTSQSTTSAWRTFASTAKRQKRPVFPPARGRWCLKKFRLARRTSPGQAHTVSPTGRPSRTPSRAAVGRTRWTPITGRVAWYQRVRGNQPDRAERRGRPGGRLDRVAKHGRNPVNSAGGR